MPIISSESNYFFFPITAGTSLQDIFVAALPAAAQAVAPGLGDVSIVEKASERDPVFVLLFQVMADMVL
jgi:hypothetical protein